MKVSVIIPAYNVAKYIKHTLQSVAIQTYQPHEIIVINDGSTDNTLDIINSFSDKVIVISQRNSGVCAARNAGINRATGEWIAFLDGDDVWHANRLQYHIDALKHLDRRILFSYCWYSHIGTETCDITSPKEPLTHKWSDFLLMPPAVILPSTTLVRRDVKTRFPEWVKAGEADDCIYYNELNQEGGGHFLNQSLVYYRQHPASATRKPNHHVNGWINLYKWASTYPKATSKSIMKHLDELLMITIRNARWKGDWVKYSTLRKYAIKRMGYVKATTLHDLLFHKHIVPIHDGIRRILMRK